MSASVRLLIIDPQVDFCDSPGVGALPVPGAGADMSRLAAMIGRLGHRIDDIDVTLDSHRSIDVAHPAWWIDAEGRHPAPFTMISASDVANGRWTPRNPGWRRRSLDYVRTLEERGKYALVIWPPHCLIGSPGHAVHPELFAALRGWEEREFAMVNFVTKGSNPFTEHYSAVAAEVPDPEDPSTLLNGGLIDALRDSDVIAIAGEALSHCVKATVEDIADVIGPEHVRKFVFLSDCSSPVPAVPGGPDFPEIGRRFIEDMRARGMRVSTSLDFLDVP
jgi:nicotinamidase-related amidase